MKTLVAYFSAKTSVFNTLDFQGSFFMPENLKKTPYLHT